MGKISLIAQSHPELELNVSHCLTSYTEFVFKERYVVYLVILEGVKFSSEEEGFLYQKEISYNVLLELLVLNSNLGPLVEHYYPSRHKREAMPVVTWEELCPGCLLCTVVGRVAAMGIPYSSLYLC